MKIPCEDCITLSICISTIRNGVDIPSIVLRDKCSLYRDFLKFYAKIDSYEKEIYAHKLRNILRVTDDDR